MTDSGIREVGGYNNHTPEEMRGKLHLHAGVAHSHLGPTLIPYLGDDKDDDDDLPLVELAERMTRAQYRMLEAWKEYNEAVSNLTEATLKWMRKFPVESSDDA